MGNLRIKLKYKSFEIEIEGEQEIVQAEFKDIKSNGLGNIVNGVDIGEANYFIEAETPTQVESIKQVNFTEGAVVSKTGHNNLPSLKDVIMKQLPSSETEWILVYSHFASKGGENFFTPKNILELYETTKRKTHSRHANLSKNIKALFGKGYFSALNDEEYILTDEGKHTALEILTRKHSATNIQVKPSAKLPNKKSISDSSNSTKKVNNKNKLEVLKDVDFRSKNNISLIDYIAQYDVKSNPDRAVIIINYLKEILHVKNVSINHVYSGFWELKCKIPLKFSSLIYNAKSREKFLDFSTTNDIKLSVQGQNHIRLDLVKKLK